MSWQRARSEEQKAERRGEIVEAGARLLEDAPLTDVSLNAIAREAGLAKSALYRYFATREEIFLVLLADDIDVWATEVQAKIAALPDDPDVHTLATTLVEGLTHNPRMVRLLGQLVSVIERNVSVEAVVDFKLRIKAVGDRQSDALAARVPWMDKEAAHQLTFLQVALLQGLWPNHELPPAVVEALEHPELQGMHLPLEAALHRGMVVILEGLKAEARRLPVSPD